MSHTYLDISQSYIAHNIRPLPPKQRFVEVLQLAPQLAHVVRHPEAVGDRAYSVLDVFTAAFEVCGVTCVCYQA